MNDTSEMKSIFEDALHGVDLSNTAVPYPIHYRTLEARAQQAAKKGHEEEREEIVCRLLANNMSISEIVDVLGLRENEIKLIEQNNISTTIPQYKKKLQERRKRRQKQSQ
jgi:hypothetical protein